MKIEILDDSFHENSVASEAGSFTKWLKIKHPEVEVDLPKNKNKVSLHDASLIMPLVNLAYSHDLINYLALVLEYAKYRFQGALENDKNEVSIEVDYQDEKNGIKKRFSFKGSETALKNTVKKFDINKFMGE